MYMQRLQQTTCTHIIALIKETIVVLAALPLVCLWVALHYSQFMSM